MSQEQRQIVATLREHLRLLSTRQLSNRRDGFDDEMDKLRALDHRARSNAGEFFTASLASSKPKNRFAEVRANEATLVRLRPLAKGDPQSYINANYVDGRRLFNVPFTYIATQSPLRETIFDFWRMVFEKGAFFIIMLCAEVEAEKVKSEVYWPKEGRELDFGAFRVKSLSERRQSDLVFRSLIIRTSRGEEHEVSHMQYIGWPDQGIPGTSAPLMEMIQNMGNSKFSVQAPIVVHCSGGIGRTGVFIALHVALALFQLERKDLDVQEIVSVLKLCRTGMVERKDQYVFLYYALLREMNRMILSAEKGVNLLKVRRHESALRKIAPSGPPINQPGVTSPLPFPTYRAPPLQQPALPYATHAYSTTPPSMPGIGQRRGGCLPQTSPRRATNSLIEAERQLLEGYIKRRAQSARELTVRPGPFPLSNRATMGKHSPGTGVPLPRNNAFIERNSTTYDSVALEELLQQWQIKNKKMRFSTTEIESSNGKLQEAGTGGLPDRGTGMAAHRLQVPRTRPLPVDRAMAEQEQMQETQSRREITPTSRILEPSIRPASIIITPQELTVRNSDPTFFSDNEGSPEYFSNSARDKGSEMRSVATVAPAIAATAAASTIAPQGLEKKVLTASSNRSEKAAVSTEASKQLMNSPGFGLIAKEEFERL